MRRRLPGFMALALLASVVGACVGERGGDAGQRPYTAIARFIPGDEVTVIQVMVSDRRALRGVELVGPGGAVIAADSIAADTVADYQQPFSRQPVGVGFDVAGTAGVALSPGGFGNFAPPGSQTFSTDQIRSTAEIRLTDPESYAREWRLWQVRLRIGDPPNPTILSLPAPQPPAAL